MVPGGAPVDYLGNSNGMIGMVKLEMIYSNRRGSEVK